MSKIVRDGYRIATEQLTVDQLRQEKPSKSKPVASERSSTAKKTPKGPSSLERKFDALIANLFPDCPPYEKDIRFHPVRRWRADVFFRKEAIIVEMEGSIWAGARGGHTSGYGYLANLRKYNEISLMGIKLLRYAINDFRDRPDEIISDLKRALSR